MNTSRPNIANAWRPSGDARDPRCLLQAAVDGERDRRVPIGREVASQRVVDLAGTGGGGKHLRVDGGELDAGEREPERDEQNGCDGRDPGGEAADEPGEPVPEAGRQGACLALGAA